MTHYNAVMIKVNIPVTNYSGESVFFAVKQTTKFGDLYKTIEHPLLNRHYVTFTEREVIDETEVYISI